MQYIILNLNSLLKILPLKLPDTILCANISFPEDTESLKMDLIYYTQWKSLCALVTQYKY